MALVQELVTDYGIYASYWKITSFILNTDRSCDLTISGYYNEQTRNAFALPMKALNYHIDASVVEAYFPTSVDLTQVYQYLKSSTPEFARALDA